MMKDNTLSFALRTLARWCVIALVVFHTSAPCSHASQEVIVTVQGVEGEILQNVLSYLRLEQEKNHPSLTEGRVRKLHEGAADDIGKALQPFGYYTPEIEAELKKNEQGTWRATYTIKPGKRVSIGRVDISITGPGSEDKGFEEFLADFPIKGGDPLDHSLYEEGKRSLQEFALNRGYLEGRTMQSEVKVYPEQGIADVTLTFDTGPRYLFGDVSFEQEILDEDFLDRFVPFRKGEPYSFSGLFDLRGQLQDTEYFDSIEIQAPRERAEGKEVPVSVILTPRKPWVFTFGIGYGTDTGPRVRGGVENRRLSRRGHKLRFDAKVSLIDLNFSTRYTIPLKDPRKDSLGFTAGIFDEELDTYDSKIFLAGASLNRATGKWKRTIFLDYKVEEFTVANDSGRPKLLVPGVSVTYTDTDDPAFTTRGWRIIAEFSGAEDRFVSDVAFLQLTAQAKLVYGIWRSGRFILRGEGGTTLVNNFSKLPASTRYFAGGDRSIRGYKYKSLGPVNEDGQVTGGKHLLVGSIEYEQRIVGKWSAAIFYDAGNAINDLSDPYAEGTGFGARWLSPIGQIRVDLAFALSKEGNPIRLHFIIGPDL